ncbi:MAG: two-component system nitrate/nitrite response regulator NarL [Sphingobacteriales bacterium]|jgi:two-component system nitrate/nitrite response regulator NarL
MYKIVIADDHQMFIDGIKALLVNQPDIEIVGEALNGEEVLKTVNSKPVDIILMDINMPVLDGIETTRQLQQKHPKVKVMMLTMYKNAEFIDQLMAIGAKGYLLKNTGKKELVKAIKTLGEGGNYFSPAIQETAEKSLDDQRRGHAEPIIFLTKREREVLTLVAKEKSTPEIASQLYISPHTVETHRKNIHHKLNIHTTAGLVKYASGLGLVD